MMATLEGPAGAAAAAAVDAAVVGAAVCARAAELMSPVASRHARDSESFMRKVELLRIYEQDDGASFGQSLVMVCTPADPVVKRRTREFISGTAPILRVWVEERQTGRALFLVGCLWAKASFELVLSSSSLPSVGSEKRAMGGWFHECHLQPDRLGRLRRALVHLRHCCSVCAAFNLH